MNVLIVGGGGREHALAWKAAQSERVNKVYVAPGNAGTATEAKMENVPIGADDIAALIHFAREAQIDLTLIGPEAPLGAGIVDQFTAQGLRCFGPSQGAAQLEGSKAFTKDFLARHHIPTAAYQNFTDAEAAIGYIRTHGAPIVVKADGLAAGKGVIVAMSEDEAIAAVRDMLAGNSFGEAGHRVVIEEFLEGEEASFICMVDGEHVLPMATSQDHKPYTGFLYAGLMITADGSPKVIEYNVRFGDPETQPIMMRLRSDLVSLCEAALAGELHTVTAEWDARAALGVVMAAGGYPGAYEKYLPISGLAPSGGEAVKVFHAGTILKDSTILTNGGRVLCVTALGQTVAEAQTLAYARVAGIHWDAAYYRHDIGYRAIAREQA
ncbi:MAG: phosphoribosylamine--glycine ligase [Gammaproteobacteria bacterium]